MKKIKEKDPFKIKKSPASGQVYALCFFTLLFLVAAITLFILYNMSPQG